MFPNVDGGILADTKASASAAIGRNEKAGDMVPEGWEALKLMGLALAAVTLYFLPTYIAVLKGNEPTGYFVWNILLGWTVVGWGILLVSAVRQSKELSDGGKPRRVRKALREEQSDRDEAI